MIVGIKLLRQKAKTHLNKMYHVEASIAKCGSQIKNLKGRNLKQNRTSIAKHKL